MNKKSDPNNSVEHHDPALKAPAASPARPEWIRLPQGGLCPWTGLTRSKLYELILPCAKNGFQPAVRSVCLAPLGTKKGVRLIHLESLLNYLHELSEGGPQDPQPSVKPELNNQA